VRLSGVLDEIIERPVRFTPTSILLKGRTSRTALFLSPSPWGIIPLGKGRDGVVKFIKFVKYIKFIK